MLGRRKEGSKLPLANKNIRLINKRIQKGRGEAQGNCIRVEIFKQLRNKYSKY